MRSSLGNSRISRLLFAFVLATALLLTFISQSCKQSPDVSDSDPPPENTFDIPAPKVDLAKPLEISRNPSDVAVCEKIKETINRSEFSQARWGVIAIGLNDGRIVCGREARRLFNPASVQKLLTSVVALDRLGSGFRFRTSVFTDRGVDKGAIKGNLILYGRGAPDLDDKRLGVLVNLLKQKGITRVEGDVIGDESHFKGDNLGDGWTWNAAQWYYGAAASALSINKNQVTVSLKDGRPVSDSRFVELSGEVKPIEDIEAIGVKRELGTNKVYVWGHGRNLDARIAINKPALLAAKILKELLEKNGVEVSGKAKSADWKSADKLDAGNSTEIVSIESEPLAETVRKMNRDSVNLYAELMLRTLGKKFGAEAPDENPKMQKLRGDDSAGASVVEKWLKEQNVATNEIAVHDGSGLSRLDLVTPEAIGRALVVAAKSSFGTTLKNSLPVSGQSGTLKGRLTNVSGRVLAKTGSITYVNSLAGYANSGSETYAFAIICNNETRKGDSSKVIDRIVSHLVGN